MHNLMVTGGAGFIGSYLIDRLMEEDGKVSAYDNLVSGKIEWIEHHMSKENFRFQSRLGNSTIFKIASCPIEDFSNGPVCTQRCSSLIPGIS